MTAQSEPLSKPFITAMSVYLVPYFQQMTPDLNSAVAQAQETIAAYGVRTRAEMVTAVRVIAYSLAGLDMLLEAKFEDSTRFKLRLRGCANHANRLAQQDEKSLQRRLACDVPEVQTAEPVPDLSDEQVQETIQLAQEQIDAYRASIAEARVAMVPEKVDRHPPGPKDDGPEPPPWHSPLLRALAESAATAPAPAPA